MTLYNNAHNYVYKTHHCKYGRYNSLSFRIFNVTTSTTLCQLNNKISPVPYKNCQREKCPKDPKDEKTACKKFLALLDNTITMIKVTDSHVL